MEREFPGCNLRILIQWGKHLFYNWTPTHRQFFFLSKFGDVDGGEMKFVKSCVHTPSTDVRDVWLSSEVILYERSLIWKSKCPASNLNISASLCWRQQEHLCTAAPNSTLVEDGGGNQLVCLAGLLVESLMEWWFQIIKAFSNSPVFSSTEIQFICCGQTPSDVCAGEK